jgi:hypothetical protein
MKKHTDHVSQTRRHAPLARSQPADIVAQPNTHTHTLTHIPTYRSRVSYSEACAPGGLVLLLKPTHTHTHTHTRTHTSPVSDSGQPADIITRAKYTHTHTHTHANTHTHEHTDHLFQTQRSASLARSQPADIIARTRHTLV